MKAARQIASLAFAIAVTLAGCSGSSTTATTTTTPPTAAAEPAEPEPTGAETIRTADLRAHVETLASDEYLGRGTLEPGLDKARDYMIAQLEGYGLEPLPGHDSFAVPYTLHEQGYEVASTSVELEAGGERRTLEAGSDFAPFFFSTDDELDAELVFAGYGVTAPKLDYDDYAGLDVEDKIVVVLRYTPDHGDENGRFAGTNHSYFQVKAKNAHDRGAAGMILVTGPAHAEGADDLRLSRGLRLLPREDGDDSSRRRGRRGGQGEGEGEEDRPFVAVRAAADEVDWLLTRTGAPGLAEVQKALDEGTRPSELELDGARARMSVARADEPRPVHPDNVVGFLEGSDPDLKDEWIVIGGHYDHLGAFDGEGDTVYNGADDNASGTAGVLELAEAFASLPEPPARSMVFIGFSGEERGLLGSRAMLAQEQLPLDKIAFMINLDMIGRNRDEPVEVVGDAFGSNVRAVTEAANADVGVDIEFGGTNYSGASDHHPFYASDVPFMFFFTGTHEDYHQLSDHADKVAFERMEKIVRVAYGVADRMANGEAPNFIHNLLWLGVSVEVGAEGAVVTAVEDRSRAAKAGVRVGDVIAGFDGTPLEAPDAVGETFRNLEPGTTFELDLARGDETVSVELERAKRGYLGVMPRGVTKEARKEHGLAEDEGVLIARVVPESPAAKAGFAEDDILIRIAGLPVGVRDLGRHLARIGAGEKVEVVVVRDGERVELDMVLGERPER